MKTRKHDRFVAHFDSGFKSGKRLDSLIKHEPHQKEFAWSEHYSTGKWVTK